MERRKYTRKLIKLNVEYDMSSDQKWLESEARDIGAGGICLITPFEIFIGKSFDIKFYMPELSKPIKVIGKVMWSEKIDEEKNSKYYNGIQFVRIDSSDKALILKYVDSATFEQR
ncbi:MAG: PilZ domain-containing protein [Spirochaetales bacterium]|nr:PilZ domain-containing protein [Spirochaetales bacterium]